MSHPPGLRPCGAQRYNTCHSLPQPTSATFPENECAVRVSSSRSALANRDGAGTTESPSEDCSPRCSDTLSWHRDEPLRLFRKFLRLSTVALNRPSHAHSSWRPRFHTRMSALGKSQPPLLPPGSSSELIFFRLSFTVTIITFAHAHAPSLIQ